MTRFARRRVSKDLDPLKDLFSDQELAALNKFGAVICIAPGELLFQEGTPGSEVAIIIEGQAKITRGSKFVAKAEVGDILGDQAVLKNEARGASVVAVTFLKISVLSIEAFANTLTQSDDFRRRLDQQIQSRAA